MHVILDPEKQNLANKSPEFRQSGQALSRYSDMIDGSSHSLVSSEKRFLCNFLGE